VNYLTIYSHLCKIVNMEASFCLYLLFDFNGEKLLLQG